MGLIWIVFLLVACECEATPIVPALTCTPTPTTRPTDKPTTGQLFWVDVPSASLEMGLLEGSAQNPVVIYLPPTYATSDHRYPVIYFLPGYSTDNLFFTDGTFQGFKVQDSMDRLITDGTIEELIVVIPKGQHSLGGSFYVNSPITGNWEDFIVEELVDYVDSNYRTIATAESRGIAGHSMGGYGALNLAMLHPEVYSAVYSLSPGLFDADGLSNSQMFHTQGIINRYLELEGKLDIMNRDEAHEAFLEERLGGDLLFTLDYGMAFAPNPDRNAPYIAYPYVSQNGELVVDDEIWDRWESGFGGIPEEIERYTSNYMQLTGIVVDYGVYDEYRWIPQGCVFFSEQLTEAGIPHELVNHSGGHSNYLRDRIELYMLPFFSGILRTE